MPSLHSFAIGGATHIEGLGAAALERDQPTPPAELSVAFFFGRAIERKSVHETAQRRERPSYLDGARPGTEGDVTRCWQARSADLYHGCQPLPRLGTRPNPPIATYLDTSQF